MFYHVASQVFIVRYSPRSLNGIDLNGDAANIFQKKVRKMMVRHKDLDSLLDWPPPNWLQPFVRTPGLTSMYSVAFLLVLWSLNWTPFLFLIRIAIGFTTYSTTGLCQGVE